MNNIMFVGKIENQQKLDGEPPHHRVRKPAFSKPGSEAPQRLAHQFKNKADVRSIRSTMLKVIKQMTDVVVPDLVTVSVSEMGQDLSLKNRGIRALIGIGTKHFESSELIFKARSVYLCQL